MFKLFPVGQDSPPSLSLSLSAPVQFSDYSNNWHSTQIGFELKWKDIFPKGGGKESWDLTDNIIFAPIKSNIHFIALLATEYGSCKISFGNDAFTFKLCKFILHNIFGWNDG